MENSKLNHTDDQNKESQNHIEDQNTEHQNKTAGRPGKKRTAGRKTAGAGGVEQMLLFVKEHVRYFTAGALLIVLVLVLAMCAKPGTGGGNGNGAGDGQTEAGTEASEVQQETYQVDAYENVNALITQYYTAYAAGDITTLSTLASPISANEQSYITLFSQYVDTYQNISCYTKSGLDSNSYLVSVSMEIKFTGVETAAPGLDFFYVRTNEQGELYIDNLYSQYNLANQENALDTSVQSLIYEFENETDVLELQTDVQDRYDAALAADADLATMIKTTIPGAIREWVAQVKEQNELAAAANTEQADGTTERPDGTAEPGTDENSDTTYEEETPEEPEQTTETLATTDRVNVRAAADTSAEKLGTVDAGTVVTRTGVDGDWSIIDYNGTTGYIKNEFLTYDLPGAQTNTASDSNTDGEDNVVLAEGTEVILQSSVKVRSGMSQDTDSIGTAYAGEKVTVVMSYAEGWTKVTWNGETGYIKSSLLQ